MQQEPDTAPIPGLDGAERQAVGRRLWNAWRAEGRGAAVLTGISGVGKSEQVVRPLLARAAQNSIPTVHIDVPSESLDVDAALLASLREELSVNGHDALVEAIHDQTGFNSSVRVLLRSGILVVVDEFQRLLLPNGRPLTTMSEALERTAKRTPDSGCLWLVSNRQVDPTWTEPFHVEELSPPEEHDAIRIVLGNLAAGDGNALFPEVERTEVVHRLGANPRVLRLLGQLLKSYTLEELLPLVRTGEDESDLVNAIEQRLLGKAAEGLSTDIRDFLRNLSVTRNWVPWALVETLYGDATRVKNGVRQLRERYLVQARASNGRPGSGPNTRYRAHPLAQEVDGVGPRRGAESWRSAHRRIGQWYAGRLRSAIKAANGDSTIAEALDGAQHHLVEAGEPALLADAVQLAGGYVERRFNWEARRPTTDSERDAQILLLRLYHQTGGNEATHYCMAVRLHERDDPGDQGEAVRHAELATKGQTNSDSWNLWIKTVYARDGSAAAITAARKASQHVTPARNLYIIYQSLGALLCWSGRTGEAVEALREGTDRALGNTRRLAETAALMSAGGRKDTLLTMTNEWLANTEEYADQALLHQALLLERRGRWREVALMLSQGRIGSPRYMPFVTHEALGWLGADDPLEAQASLDRYPILLRMTSGAGLTWIASFVALRTDDVARSSQLLGIYLDIPTPPTDRTEILAALLHAWDNPKLALGEATVTLHCPVLPTSLTGLLSPVVRPLYGNPVLTSPDPSDDRPHILVVATEWFSAHGGLSTFNRHLCAALAKAGKQVSCVVPAFTDEERTDAATKGVTLVRAPLAPGASTSERLSRKPELPSGPPPELIIGHGRITGPAAHSLTDHFPTARRVHFVHMIPDDIERHKMADGVDVGALAEERQEVELELGKDAHLVAAVGPRMYGWYSRDLSAKGVDEKRIIPFDPGFDVANDDPRTPPPGAPVAVLVFGRTEDANLKGLDIAARGFAIMRERRSGTLPAVELLVRGAPANASQALAEEMKGWADGREPPVRVRPYTTQAERLSADLRTASLVLMPSRAEGFGLVGLEAIIAGTPVLVSSESGLGELLVDLLDPEEAARVVVRTTGDLARDGETWSRAMEAVLLNRPAAFRSAGELQTRLSGLRTWAGAVTRLLESVATT